MNVYYDKSYYILTFLEGNLLNPRELCLLYKSPFVPFAVWNSAELRLEKVPCKCHKRRRRCAGARDGKGMEKNVSKVISKGRGRTPSAWGKWHGKWVTRRPMCGERDGLSQRELISRLLLRWRGQIATTTSGGTSSVRRIYTCTYILYS